MGDFTVLPICQPIFVGGPFGHLVIADLVFGEVAEVGFLDWWNLNRNTWLGRFRRGKKGESQTIE